MNKSGRNPSQRPVPMAPEGIWSNFLFLSVDVIDTTWASLRSGPARVSATDLRDMPIRVVLQDGRYEVVDGFKRLSRWKEAGAKQVPALVESCNDGLSPKRLLLECNNPKRTLGAIDEARVVNSLIEDDGLAVRTVANLLGRRKEWVVGRLALLRLSLPAQQSLSTGRINLMVARLLAAINAKDQDAILTAAEKHSLKMREIQLLIQTWRSASDEEKPGLLADPLFKREQQSSPNYSARLKALEIKLSGIKSALDEFRSLILPKDLADAEQRRLQALCASIQNQITQMAEGFKSASVDARLMSPAIHQDTDSQPEFYDVSEDLYDECEFFPCVPVLSPCHLTSSADLRCEL